VLQEERAGQFTNSSIAVGYPSSGTEIFESDVAIQRCVVQAGEQSEVAIEYLGRSAKQPDWKKISALPIPHTS
jgi:hypothetical protein